MMHAGRECVSHTVAFVGALFTCACAVVSTCLRVPVYGRCGKRPSPMMGCVCVCAKGMNSIMLKLRGSTFPLSYHYCKPSMSSPAKGLPISSGPPYVQGAANTPQLLALQPSHNATRHILHALCPTSPHRPSPCVPEKDGGGVRWGGGVSRRQRKENLHSRLGAQGARW